MINKEIVSLISGIIWGTYAIVIGTLAVYFSYNNNWAWLSIVVAIVGNSAHLIVMHYSAKGLTIQAQGSSPPGPPKS